jgi:MoaA/NifB/PqqE/SkfB family radical SAM enzyme
MESQPETDRAGDRLSFIWMEVTGRCQLQCRHCYSSSGPQETHGTMTRAEWLRVVDEAADLGSTRVQLIGGEPTVHPDLPALVDHGLSRMTEVEIYTNLIHVGNRLWDIYAQPGVRLATSYYSADPSHHDRITGRPGSHARTRANIVSALDRGIPVRVGMVEMDAEQGLEVAEGELRALGVADVRRDRLREVGRGERTAGPGVDQLCGHCLDSKLAISPWGEVWPCPLARWMRLGSVHDASLESIYHGIDAARVRGLLGARLTGLGGVLAGWGRIGATTLSSALDVRPVQ